MAGRKLSDLTTTTSLSDNDLVYVVDVSAATGSKSKGIAKSDLAALMGTTAAATQPVETEYADITALLADQGNQTTGFLQYVVDASADPNITSGEAYYEKLATSTATLADDYRLLSDTETEIIKDSNSYRVFRIQDIQDEGTPLTSVGGGKVSFEYSGANVTAILFNKLYTDAIEEFYGKDVSIRFHNRATKRYETEAVASTAWTTVNTDYYRAEVTGTNIQIADLSANNRVEFFIVEAAAGGGGSTAATAKTGTTIVFTERADYNFDDPNKGEAVTLDVTGAVNGTSVALMVHSLTEPTFTTLTKNVIKSGEWLSGVPCLFWFLYDNSQYILNIQPEKRTQLATTTLTIASGGATQNDLTWTAVTNANNYKVYRHTTNDLSAATEIYDGALLLYSDTGLSTNTLYYYWVVAEDTNKVYPRSQYATNSYTAAAQTTHLTDDFGDASLDTAKWDLTTDTNVSSAESGGTYTFTDTTTAGTGNDTYLQSDNQFSNNGVTLVLKADLTKSTQNNATYFMRLNNIDTGTDYISIQSRSVSNSVGLYLYEGGVQTYGFVYSLSGGISNSFKIVVNDTDVSYYYWSGSAWVFIVAFDSVPQQSWNVKIGRQDAAISGNTYDIDDVYCTNYDFTTLNP